MERSDTDNQVNREPDFRSVPAEVENLLADLREQRIILREMTARLAAIEKHVRRAFQVPKSPPKTRGNRSSVTPRVYVGAPQLQQLFDELRSLWMRERTDEVQAKLSALSLEDLRALAAEVGSQGGAKTPRSRLVSAIIGKLRESALLGSNLTLSSPPHDKATTEDATASEKG